MFDGHSHHYFGGPFLLFIPPQSYYIYPYFNQQNKSVNVDFRYPPVIVSWSNLPVMTEFPSEPIPPGATSISSDPPPVSSAPAETAPTFDRKYHQPPAPELTDPVEDFGPVIDHNGTEIDDTTWMSDKVRA